MMNSTLYWSSSPSVGKSKLRPNSGPPVALCSGSTMSDRAAHAAQLQQRVADGQLAGVELAGRGDCGQLLLVGGRAR